MARRRSQPVTPAALLIFAVLAVFVVVANVRHPVTLDTVTDGSPFLKPAAAKVQSMVSAATNVAVLGEAAAQYPASAYASAGSARSGGSLHVPHVRVCVGHHVRVCG